MNNLAPIVLFCYNRPDHTEQTLNALMKNVLASKSKLFIFCDGPKPKSTNKQLAQIKNVRSIVRKEKWCGDVSIIESDINKGLADSIKEGVTQIINEFGKIIVLEDDIITSKGFLKYMNDALTFYASNQNVMHVSAYMFPIKIKNENNTFFYNTASCWGWGTWQSAWAHYNDNANYLLKEIKNRNKIDEFNIGGHADFYQQLNMNAKGELKTWAVKWYASFFLKNGFSLHPKQSLTKNIGHDDSGQNCAQSDLFFIKNLANEIHISEIPIIPSKLVNKLMKNFYRMNYSFHSSNKLKKALYLIQDKVIKFQTL